MGKITLMDGATGTRLWDLAAQKGIEKQPVWIYNLTQPDLVKQVTREYIEAGSQMVCTNTFAVNRPALKKFPQYTAAQVVSAALKLCREAAGSKEVKVALDIGPLPELMEPYGDLEEDEAVAIYDEILSEAMKNPPDVILFETFIDLPMLAAVVRKAAEYGIPVLASMSFEKTGRTIMGNSPADMISQLEPLGVSAVGANCSAGPAMLMPVMREFSEKTKLPLIFKPNSGIPALTQSGQQMSPYTAEMFAAEIAPALDFVSYVGACCGSNAQYIRKLAEKIG